MESFIRTYDGVLAAEFCNDVIARFEAADGRYSGRVHNVHGESIVNENRKQTTELVISGKPEWRDVHDHLKAAYIECVNRYADEFPHLSEVGAQLSSEVFRIKKYDTDGLFDWHMDCVGDALQRVLAIQYYFNDVAQGGETEFQYQSVKVKPVQGRVVIFPTLWTYLHRGARVLNGPKYICTNFMRID